MGDRRLYHEWQVSAPGRPTSRTIDRRWGWRPFIAAALDISIDELQAEGRRQSRDVLLRELLAVRDELGDWPTGNEWERAGLRPARRTYVRAFGSWDEACRQADRSRPAPRSSAT